MNKVIIAAAGSGKTEFIVNESLKISSPILVTTFTDKNADEIRTRFYKKNGVIPPNVIILPWYTFLLTHFIRPYQDIFYKPDIKGVVYVGGQSAPYTKKAQKITTLVQAIIFIMIKLLNWPCP